ncbi:hypothetical protein [Sulfodiicoccus acidiphilus]
MARRLNGESGWFPNLDPEEVELACRRLQDAGLIQRVKHPPKMSPTSSVKPWLKVKAKDGSPRGRYYQLTKEGRRIVAHLRSS